MLEQIAHGRALHRRARVRLARARLTEAHKASVATAEHAIGQRAHRSLEDFGRRGTRAEDSVGLEELRLHLARGIAPTTGL